jgi:Zn-dependent protease
MEWLIDASAWVLPVVLAITLHEAAHGWMANKFGDDTAKQLGRITANPFKHIDRYGTIIVPALLLLAKSPFVFGYAKPVPVNFSRLQPFRKGMFWVAVAGVLVNFALAIITGLLLHIDMWLTPEDAPWLFQNLYRSLQINCVLIVFNMIPILPLDGGRAVYALLPEALQRPFRKLERFGIWLVVLVFLVPIAFGETGLSEKFIAEPAFWLISQVLWLTGNIQ